MSDEEYKQRLRQYALIGKIPNQKKTLEDLRDKYLDTVRLINEVLGEFH